MRSHHLGHRQLEDIVLTPGHLASLGVAAMLAACTADVPGLGGTRFQCFEDERCPAGFVCERGECVDDPDNPRGDGGPEDPDAAMPVDAEDLALRPACAALWDFDDPAPLGDGCGSLALTAFNSPTFSATGVRGGAMAIEDGAVVSSVDYDAAIVTGTLGALGAGRDVTAGCWVRPSASMIGGFSNIMRNRSAGNTGFWLAMDTGNYTVRFDASGETSATGAQANTWQHIVVRYNDVTPGADVDGATADDEIAIFVDGVKGCAGASCPQADASLTVSPEDFGVGGWPFDNKIFDPIDGQLDECFILSSATPGGGAALSADEICTLCRCGFHGNAEERECDCELPAGVQCAE